MRIDGNGRVAGPRGPGSSSKSSSGSGRFSLALADAAADADAAHAAPPVAGLDAMLALQSIEPAGERRRKALKRGRTILDSLDRLRLGLLDGDSSAAEVQDLARLVQERREASDDAGLESVLAEIELRAAVEIAKRDRGRR